MRKVILLSTLVALLLTGCTSGNTVTKHGVITEPADNSTKSAIDVLEEKPLNGKDVTLLTDTYFEVTQMQGCGLITNYVDEDKYVIYVHNDNGSECIQYQIPTAMYSYAMLVDEDGGTSSSGVGQYKGDTKFSYTKTTLAEKFEERLRPVFDRMVYRKVLGHDYVYTYKGGSNSEDAEDITKQNVSVYVDVDSYRVSKVVSEYLCYNFRYSDSPIEQMYDVDTILSMGKPVDVDNIEDIVQMTLMFSFNTVKYDEEYIQQVKDLFEELEAVASTGSVQ